MAPDPKPARRVKDPGLMRLMHLTPGPCALADATCKPTINLHHVYPRSQGGDDVRANLMWLCGSGVTGHHGKLHQRDEATLLRMHQHLHADRADTFDYLIRKLGTVEAAVAWVRQACK